MTSEGSGHPSRVELSGPVTTAAVTSGEVASGEVASGEVASGEVTAETPAASHRGSSGDDANADAAWESAQAEALDAATSTVRSISDPPRRTAPAINTPIHDSADRSSNPSDDVADAENGRPVPSSEPEPRHPHLSLVTGTSPERQAAVQADMDRLALEQALLDVEVANARVIDLTARLVEANGRAAALRTELDARAAEDSAAAALDAARHEAAQAELSQREAALRDAQVHLQKQQASTAFRWASKVWNLRNALRS